MASVRTLISRLLWLEPAWIAVLSPLILFPGRWIPASFQPAVILALFLLWPLRLFVEGLRKPLTNSPITLPVVAILLWLPINLWAAPDKATALQACGYLALGVALYTALVRWPPVRHSPFFLAWLVLLFGLGLSLVAPVITDWKPEFRLFQLPAYDWLQAIPIDLGDTIHANILAGALVLVLPIAAALSFGAPGQQPRGLRAFAFVVTFLSFGVIVLTQSRGGYLAVAAGLAVICLWRWPRLRWLVPVALLAAAFAIQQIGPGRLLDALSGDSALGGWSGRLNIWQNSVAAFHDFVFTGLGIGAFTTVLPLMYPLKVDIAGYPHAHNLLLQIALDLGAPGLIAYLAIVINLLLMLIPLLKRRDNVSIQEGAESAALTPAGATRNLAAGLLGALVAMQVHGLLDAATWGNKLAFAPWLIFAFVTVLFLQRTRRGCMGGRPVP